MNEYNDVNMLNSLVQKNIRYGVSIDEIVIDMGTIPVTGKILSHRRDIGPEERFQER